MPLNFNIDDPNGDLDKAIKKLNKLMHSNGSKKEITRLISDVSKLNKEFGKILDQILIEN